MRKLFLYKTFILFFALILSAGLGELVIRYNSAYDLDDNTWITSRIIKPYKLPINSAKNSFRNFIQHPNPAMVYDSLYGWTLPASSTYWSTNEYGMRTGKDTFSLTPKDSTYRIALFGDSYIYGAEVDYEETIGYLLQKILRKKGIKVEVLNFGVGGYGIDQAYLKWQHLGKHFSPDMVILGFQPENVMRNLNLYRALYSRKEALPFVKPRYILNEKKLRLINWPTPSPQLALKQLQHIDEWPFAKYESYYTPKDYQAQWWLQSKLIAYLISVLEENRWNIASNEKSLFELNTKATNLATAIITQFKNEVEKNNSQFILLHLPRKVDLEYYKENKVFTYADLLNSLGPIAPLIDSKKELMHYVYKDSIQLLFEPQQHYTIIGNKIFANKLSQYISNRLKKRF